MQRLNTYSTLPVRWHLCYVGKKAKKTFSFWLLSLFEGGAISTFHSNFHLANQRRVDRVANWGVWLTFWKIGSSFL